MPRRVSLARANFCRMHTIRYSISGDWWRELRTHHCLGSSCRVTLFGWVWAFCLSFFSWVVSSWPFLGRVPGPLVALLRGCWGWWGLVCALPTCLSPFGCLWTKILHRFSEMCQNTNSHGPVTKTITAGTSRTPVLGEIQSCVLVRVGLEFLSSCLFLGCFFLALSWLGPLGLGWAFAVLLGLVGLGLCLA